MRIKFLSIIAGFLALGVLVSSCFDSEELEYSPNPIITLFELDTIHGVNYKFTIDQVRGLIYNEDSLPVGSDTILDKILIDTVANASMIVTMKTYSSGLDSLVNLDDSMDLRPYINAPDEGKYLTLKSWAPDMRSNKEYNISIRVHKQDPDSVRWQYRGEIGTGLAEEVKAVALNRNIYAYSATGGTLNVYRCPMDGDAAWAAFAVQDNGAFGGMLPASLVASGGQLYATSATQDGKVYASPDGIAWTAADEQQFGGTVLRLLAPWNGQLTFVRRVDGTDYFASTLSPAADEDFLAARPQEVPGEFPANYLSFTSYTTSTGQQGVLLVGEPAASATDDDPVVPWGYMGGQWVAFEPNNTVSECPHMERPTIMFYDGQFYIFGDEFEGFYTSASGLAWEKPQAKFCFPQFNWRQTTTPTPQNPDFRGRKLYSAVQDTDNQYIYLLFSREEDVTFNITIQVTEDLEQSRTITYDHDSEMWRGRLNRLGFELAQQSGQ